MRAVDKFRAALTPRSPKEENICARYTKHGLLTLSLYVPRKHVAIRATATFSGPYTPGTTNLLVVSLYTVRERVAIRVTTTCASPYRPPANHLSRRGAIMPQPTPLPSRLSVEQP